MILHGLMIEQNMKTAQQNTLNTLVAPQKEGAPAMTDAMRSEFEKWALTECFDLTAVGGFYSDNETDAAYKAWQAARTVPEGFVVVPIDPTPEMQAAGAQSIRFDTTTINKLWTGNKVYRAMLSAAPEGKK